MQLVPHQFGACSKADSTNFQVGHRMIYNQGMRPAGRFVASKPEKNFSISVKWCGFLLLANNFRLVCDVFISDIYTRRHADVTSSTQGEISVRPLFFQEAFADMLPQIQVRVEAGCDGPFEGILVGITSTSTLVTPFGAIPFQEAMSISPHDHVLDGSLCEETWQATKTRDAMDWCCVKTLQG